MLKTERQENIIKILSTNKNITAKKLSQMLFTSYSSIRRDLETLEKSGLVICSYGKIELVETPPILISYPIRMGENTNKKQLIAKKAASLIHEGDVIFIDPSSSCTYLAKELTNIKGITIVTNNVEILYFMTQFNINVICTGGVQSSYNRYALLGSATENTFRNIRANFTIFSARSLTSDGKIYDMYYDETHTRQIMFENSDKSIFLCDSSKLDTVSPYYQCDLSDIDYLVTDSSNMKIHKKNYPNLKIL